MDPTQLLKEIIRPVLQDLSMWSEPAERLLLGTACQESSCGQYVRQIGGPALGIFQMEPATHDDIWDRFLAHHPDLSRKLNRWRAQYGNGMGPGEMVGNNFYAAAMCRIHYLRVADSIPDYLDGQAHYWKRFYNTVKGHGTVEQYKNNWSRFVGVGVI